MVVIKNDIKNGTIKKLYLIYGEEGYLVNLYKNKLTKAAIGDGDSMNLEHYQGSDTDLNEVRSFAETMPFFADRRVAVLEDTGWFAKGKKASDDDEGEAKPDRPTDDLSATFADLPDTAVCIFVEKDVDARSKFFKFIKENGHVAECKKLGEDDIGKFVASTAKSYDKMINNDNIREIIMRVGTDLNTLKNETEKIASYVGDREWINREDIDAICSETIESKIFVMCDAVAERDKKKAVQLLEDLLELRQNPMAIMALLTKHFRVLLQIKSMSKSSLDKDTMARNAGVPSFTIKKYAAQAKEFSFTELRHIIEFGVELDEDFKTGRDSQDVIVELFVASCLKF